MGQTDPDTVSAQDVVGGNPATVYVKFVSQVAPYDTDSVSYSGDTDALGPNPPSACPSPPSGGSLSETHFTVPTVAVSESKSITVSVHGPTKVRSGTFNVLPSS